MEENKTKRPLVRSKHNMFRMRPSREDNVIRKITDTQDYDGYEMTRSVDRNVRDRRDIAFNRGSGHKGGLNR